MITRRQLFHQAAIASAYLGFPGIGSFQKIISPALQSETRYLYPIRVRGKDGFIDRGGAVVIPPTFDEASPFQEGFARVKNNGRFGYIDMDGSMVVPPIYERAGHFQCGLACVKSTGKCGYINHAGQTITPLIFDEGYAFNENMAAVVIDGHCGFIDSEGRMAIPPKFKVGQKLMTHGFGDGLASICVDGLYGYINRSGEVVIQSFATEASLFSHGVASVRRGKECYFIGRDGKRSFGDLCFQSADISFHEGLAAVEEKGSGKWGFINRQGNWIIPAQFEDANGFSDGLAAVEVKGGLSGFINNLGEMVIPPTWRLAGYCNNGLADVSNGLEWDYINVAGQYVWRS